jgi:hypothetical protein
MPASGRELFDLQAALKRLLQRFPKGRGRVSLDEDVRQLLGLAYEMATLIEPAGRSDDGEESPGEAVARKARRGVDREESYRQMARKLGPDDGSGNNTPGRRAALSRSKGRKITTLRDV